MRNKNKKSQFNRNEIVLNKTMEIERELKTKTNKKMNKEISM